MSSFVIRLPSGLVVLIPRAVTEVLTNADRLLAAILSGQRDFDRAKAEVMARTSL